jgi:hypothetical protein
MRHGGVIASLPIDSIRADASAWGEWHAYRRAKLYSNDRGVLTPPEYSLDVD